MEFRIADTFTSALGRLTRDEQKAVIQADIEKMVKSKSWQDALAAKGWADTYLAGDAFKAQLAEDVSATAGILKDVGLVK